MKQCALSFGSSRDSRSLVLPLRPRGKDGGGGRAARQCDLWVGRITRKLDLVVITKSWEDNREGLITLK